MSFECHFQGHISFHSVSYKISWIEGRSLVFFIVPTHHSTRSIHFDEMFSVSFVVCIISTILIAQTGHCEERSPVSPVTPLPHSAGDATKVKTETEVNTAKNGSTASSFNSTKGSAVEDTKLKHSRKIKNTSIDYAPVVSVVKVSSNETAQSKDVTEDKSIQHNPQVTKQESAIKDKKIATTKLPSSNGNSDSVKNNNQINDTKVVKNTELSTKTTAKPAVKPSSTSTTTTTTATTTTTTPAPIKKPTVTFSVEDVPDLLNSARKSVLELKGDENEPHILQSSESISDRGSGHNFLVPVIGMIFIIPFLIIVANCTTRRVRDYWSKRKYRRMDYLIEDMYN